jgi:hypothetical protein
VSVPSGWLNAFTVPLSLFQHHGWNFPFNEFGLPKDYIFFYFFTQANLQTGFRIEKKKQSPQ